MIGVSLFSSAGIAESYFEELGINIVTANEIISQRAELYKSLYPKTKMVSGNILDNHIFQDIIRFTPKKIDFLIASPPCQGISVAGKNRNIEQMLSDKRNYLIFKIIEFIQLKTPEFVIIENVPTLLKLLLPFNGKLLSVVDILNLHFGDAYNIETDIFDAANFGVAQRRTRAIIRLYEKGKFWAKPIKQKKTITLKEIIGSLPSLESGQKSNIKWHFARTHSKNHIEWMRHTPTGKSAFENNIHIPVKANGEKIKSYMTTYKRMKWDEPAPTITIRNDAISSQLNVHPGRHLRNGTYSDARVLTPLELMLLSSLPQDWKIPDQTSELLIRKVIGECIPPLMTKNIVSQINKQDDFKN